MNSAVDPKKVDAGESSIVREELTKNQFLSILNDEIDQLNQSFNNLDGILGQFFYLLVLYQLFLINKIYTGKFDRNIVLYLLIEIYFFFNLLTLFNVIVQQKISKLKSSRLQVARDFLGQSRLFILYQILIAIILIWIIQVTGNSQSRLFVILVFITIGSVLLLLVSGFIFKLFQNANNL